MKKTRPLIAVSGPDRGGTLAWWFTWLALRRAGATAVRLTPSRQKAWPNFDGLIIGGGADVSPDLYGQKPLKLPTADRDTAWLRQLFIILFYPLLLILRRLFSVKHYQGLDEARDRLEFALLEQALQQQKPVLGICRGAQLINVSRGGSLHQDIAAFYRETPQVWSILPKKTIYIKPGTRLAAILQTASMQVNAMHKQSIDSLGTDLHVCARESNDVVQAIEADAGPLLLGVQWHPEYLPHLSRQQRIFQFLVNEARR